MRHLALRCPRCRQEVTVWIGDLGQTFQCKRCRVPFHVNSSGKCDRGPRPDIPAFDPYALETRARVDWLDRWGSIPRAVRWVVGAAVLLAAGFGVFSATRPAKLDVPETLIERTRFAAEALLHNNEQSLLAICEPSASISARRWLELKRPANWSIWDQADAAKTQTSIVYQNPQNGTACTVATAVFPPPQQTVAAQGGARAPGNRRAPVGPKIELVMFWKMSDDGRWTFDASRTVRESTRR